MPPSSPSDFTMIIYGAAFSVFSILSLLYLTFAPITAATWITAGAVLASAVLIYGVVRWAKWALDKWHGTREITRLERTNNEMLVGLGAVAVVTTIARVAVFFVGFDFHIMFYLLCITLFTCFLFHAHFTYGYNRYCEFPNAEPVSEGFLAGLILLSFVLSFRLEIPMTDSKNEHIIMLLWQAGFTFLQAVCSVEYSIVRNYGMCWKRENGQRMYPIVGIPQCFSEPLMMSYAFIVFNLLMLQVFLYGFGLISWITLSISVGGIVGALVLVRGVHKTMSWAHQKLSVKKFTQIKLDLIIGFGGIIIVSTVPRVLVYFFGLDVQILLPSLLLSLFTAVSFYNIFISRSRDLWSLDFSSHLKPIFVLILTHVVIFIANIRIAITYDTGYEIETIICFQFGFMWLTGAAMVDLMVILMGGLTVKEVQASNGSSTNEIRSSQAALEDGRRQNVTFRSHECNICCMVYNTTTRIPRILSKCGHTVCESCVKNLIQRETTRIRCPMCQRETTTNGEANSLPKNFALLDMLQDHQ